MQASLETTMTADLQLTIINTFGELLVSFDSKRILIISRLLFAIGSALTAAAPSMDAFIIGKAITGFGSSGTYVSVIVIITAMTSAETRGRYFGYIGFMWGLGTMSVGYLFSLLCTLLNECSELDLLLVPAVGAGASTSI
ncbi:MAG: hypothetical protein LQ346_008555 [Caloplaca aetnensis]|nr:MAG: hypothetical protein LQ346_008555 [Caloplaca aetnensis]